MPEHRGLTGGHLPCTAPGRRRQEREAGPAALRSWTAHLDALEAWTRRAEAALRGGDDPLEPFDAVPEGRLPAELELRARALVQAMAGLQELGARRRVQLVRARRYAQD